MTRNRAWRLLLRCGRRYAGANPTSVNHTAALSAVAAERLAWESSERSPFVAWAAAALIAGAGTTGVSVSVAVCEPEPQQGGSDWDEAAQQQAVAEAKAILGRSWRELDEKLHRHEASLPAGFALARPRVPTIGAENGRLSVRIPVRPGVDATTVLSDVVSSVCGKLSPAVADGSMRLKVAECGAARVFSLEPDAPAANPAALTVQVHMPKQGQGQSLVEFLKRGPLTYYDMVAIASTMRTANRIEPGSGLGMQAGVAVDDMLEQMMADMSHMFNGGQDLFGRLSDFGDAFERFTSQFEDGDYEHGDKQPLTGHDMSPWQRSPPLQQEAELLPQRPDQHRHRRHPQQQQQQEVQGAAAYAYGSPEANQAVDRLTKMGCMVHPPGNAETVDWGMLAGYEEQKNTLQEGLLMPLQHPEVFEEVAKATRKHPGSNRPRAVLFEGPPGCGKTTSARVIATQAAVPLVYVPLEAVGSKWYGESEKLLADVFRASEALDGCILFFDEVDSLATSRGGDMHEATRKLLGVLLREMDGFDAGRRSIVIGATNRRSDLDPALLSRFDTAIRFPLPDAPCRAEILKTYAQQLSQEEVEHLASLTKGMSGRDLRDICSRTERAWASKIIRNEVQKGQLPPVDEYVEAAKQQQDKTAGTSFDHFLGGVAPGSMRPLAPQRRAMQ